MISVTKPFLPPIEEYQELIQDIWNRGWLTNQGPNVQTLEEKLSMYLELNNFSYVNNGTIAIQLAIQVLGLGDGDEIITTPFTYVASTSSILLEKCTPVFVDIDKNTLQIDVTKIEEKINEKTKAILAVHVFGLPCNVSEIKSIAKKYNLKIIYDAAHAFGVKYLGKSLLSYGDISTCSFHATKLFHTIEGGCVVTNSSELHEIISLKLRFGHNGDDHICLGTNAKASEFHAAMGLVNLKYIDEIIIKRKAISTCYDSILYGLVTRPIMPEGLEYNYAYYPVIFKTEDVLLKVNEILNKNNIYPRRYFYPSLDTLDYIEKQEDCVVSQDISKRILCLPLYHDLTIKEANEIAKLIAEVLV
jgi:dTDP-4-amino-4,6-dideoxygalactose transaminase